MQLSNAHSLDEDLHLTPSDQLCKRFPFYPSIPKHCGFFRTNVSHSSTCYNRHSNKERYWIEWTTNARVIRQSSNSKWCWKACSVTPRKKKCVKNLVSQAR